MRYRLGGLSSPKIWVALLSRSLALAVAVLWGCMDVCTSINEGVKNSKRSDFFDTHKFKFGSISDLIYDDRDRDESSLVYSKAKRNGAARRGAALAR